MTGNALYPPTPESELFVSAQNGDHKAVQVLLRAGAKPDRALDPVTGWSALAVALIGGHNQVVSELVQARASASVVDRRGNTAIHACAAGGSAHDGDEVGLDSARTMLKGSPQLAAAPNHSGVTALHLAAQHGKRALIEVLVQHGGDLGCAAIPCDFTRDTSVCLMHGSALLVPAELLMGAAATPSHIVRTQILSACCCSSLRTLP